jgi:hypothetical protein
MEKDSGGNDEALLHYFMEIGSDGNDEALLHYFMHSHFYKSFVVYAKYVNLYNKSVAL